MLRIYSIRSPTFGGLCQRIGEAMPLGRDEVIRRGDSSRYSSDRDNWQQGTWVDQRTEAYWIRSGWCRSTSLFSLVPKWLFDSYFWALYGIEFKCRRPVQQTSYIYPQHNNSTSTFRPSADVLPTLRWGVNPAFLIGGFDIHLTFELQCYGLHCLFNYVCLVCMVCLRGIRYSLYRDNNLNSKTQEWRFTNPTISTAKWVSEVPVVARLILNLRRE